MNTGNNTSSKLIREILGRALGKIPGKTSGKKNQGKLTIGSNRNPKRDTGKKIQVYSREKLLDFLEINSW